MRRIALALRKTVARAGKYGVVAALVGALPIAGCRGAGSAKLEGHWRGKRADGVGASGQAAANVFAQQMEIVARGNQITVSTPAMKSPPSAYVVDDESASTLVLHTEKEGAGTQETFSFTDDGKTMTWRVGDGHGIVFEKL